MESETSFRLKRATRRKRIVTTASIGIIISISFFFFIFASLKNSDAYDVSITAIEQNVEIPEATGGIVGYGSFPTASVSISNGYEEASYAITVKGKDQDMLVRTHLTKEPNQDWVIDEFYWSPK